MALVEFQDNESEEEFHVRSPRINFFGDPETPSMIKFLMRTKIAKTEKQALIILIVIIIVAILAAIVVYKIFVASSQSPLVIDIKGHVTNLKQYILDSAHQMQ